MPAGVTESRGPGVAPVEADTGEDAWATDARSRMPMYLQRLDVQVAELDPAAVTLEAQVPLGAQQARVLAGMALVVVEVGVHDLAAVHLHQDVPSPGHDAHPVPLPGRAGDVPGGGHHAVDR